MKNDNHKVSQLVNVTHACRICCISRARFYTLLKAGAGPEPVLVDGARYFERARLVEWNRGRKANKKRGGKPK
jgi:hypothetical protein